MTISPQETEAWYQTYLLSNYKAPEITLVCGEGAYVWDDRGQKYLDFSSGIAVNSLGHSHPYWVDKIQQQVALLTHTSNLFGILFKPFCETAC